MDYVKRVAGVMMGGDIFATGVPDMVRNVAQRVASEMRQPVWTPYPAWDTNGRMRVQMETQTPQEFTTSLAVPGAIGGLAEAVPSFARASQAFDTAAKSANNVALDLSEVGDVALKTRQLAQSGGSMPKVVRDFITRGTDPKQGP
jgi:hypothetical protein